MSTLRYLACAASLLITATATTVTTAQPAPAAFSVALDAYERNHWDEAYRAMARLADEGHAEAARVALLMLRHGPALYGQRFQATPYQELQWTWVQSCGAGCAERLQQTAVAPSGC